MATPLHLKILIVGAGISGLTLANALVTLMRQTADLTITILESNHELTEEGAGIQLSPNATRALRSLGLQSACEDFIFLPDDIKVRSYTDSTELASIPLNIRGAAEMNYGSEYWCIARADLQRVLAEAAVAKGAKIEFGKRVQSVDVVLTTVLCHDGTRFSADLIVGADGIGSAIRPSIKGNTNIKPRHLGMCAIRALLPRSLMESSEVTSIVLKSASVWNSPDQTASVICYPIRRGNYYNLVVVKNIPYPSSFTRSELEALRDPKSVRGTFVDADPIVRQMLDYTDDYSVWSLSEIPPLDRWVSDEAAIALIGDAAHAMAPHLAQGAALSIEDGIVLADSLRRIHTKDDLGVVLAAYQTLRKERVDAIAAISRDLSAARATLNNIPTDLAGGTVQRKLSKSGEAFSIVDLYFYDGLQETEKYFLANPIAMKR